MLYQLKICDVDNENVFGEINRRIEWIDEQQARVFVKKQQKTKTEVTGGFRDMLDFYGMDFGQAITEGLGLPSETTETIIEAMNRRWDEISCELAREGLDDLGILVGQPDVDRHRLLIGQYVDTEELSPEDMSAVNGRIFAAAVQLAVIPWTEKKFENGELSVIGTMDSTGVLEEYCRFGWGI